MWTNNIKYEEPRRYDFRINDFTGGICNTVSENRIQPNEASDLLNVRFEQDGILKKRNGFAIDKKYSSLLHGIGGNLLKVFVIEPYSSHKKGYFLLINGNRLVYVSTNDEVKVLPWSRKATDKFADGCQFGDKFFFVDGGIYINFFKISELETKPSSEIKHYLVTVPPEDFTPTPKPATRGVFKEKKSPDGAYYYWYEPCQAEMEDGYKGAPIGKFFATMCKVHKDRLYLSGNIGRPNQEIMPEPNMIYISDVMNPFYFPASLTLQTPPTGDKITCLRHFNDALIVGRKEDVYAIHGNTNRMDMSNQFSLRKINTHTGIVNNESADTVFNFLFYVGSDGNCYKLTSTSTDERLLATSQVNLKIDFKLPPFNHTLEDLKNCHTGFDPITSEWYVQTGDNTFIYNYRNMAWVRWKGVDCMQFIPTPDKFYYVKRDCSFNIIDDEIFYDIDPDNPQIRIPIQFYWISKNIDFGKPSRVKQIRDTFLISEIIGTHPSDIRIKYEADYVAVVKEHNISSEIALWNLARWDMHRFVYKNIIRSLPIMVGRRCRNFKIFIGNGYEFKGIVNELPSPQNSEEGQLYYLRNKDLSSNIFNTTLEYGGIEGTNGTEISGRKHIRSVDYTNVLPDSKYEVSIQHRHPKLITSVIMYDNENNHVGTQYVSYEDGYIFRTTQQTTKVRFSFTDATTQDDLTLQEVFLFEVLKYNHEENLDDPFFTDGFYIRTKRDSETRLYYKKIYDKDMYQPVKVHEINGIYELRGYR